MNLVIVESPAKAKTIEKYLGKDYKVLASFGHVRDLPSKNGSVDPENKFAMSWSVDTQSKKRIRDIQSALGDADKLILATDPDREGEAISWHLLEVLSKKKEFWTISLALRSPLFCGANFRARVLRAAFSPWRLSLSRSAKPKLNSLMRVNIGPWPAS